MRVTEVKHSQTDLNCGRCGAEIKASRDEKQVVENKRTGKKTKKVVRVLGDSYRWIKFRHGGKRIRCMKSECRFRASDMTSSDKLSQLYGAQETAEDNALDWAAKDGVEALQDIRNELVEQVREVSEGYGESADNMEQAFPNGSSQIDEIREKADNLEQWASDLENLDFDEWDGPDLDDGEEEPKKDSEEVKNTDGQTPEEWADHERDKLLTEVGNCPL